MEPEIKSYVLPERFDSAKKIESIANQNSKVKPVFLMIAYMAITFDPIVGLVKFFGLYQVRFYLPIKLLQTLNATSQ